MIISLCLGSQASIELGDEERRLAHWRLQRDHPEEQGRRGGGQQDQLAAEEPEQQLAVWTWTAALRATGN